jgi:NAD+ synthase (glutamine-hydrolysing)
MRIVLAQPNVSVGDIKDNINKMHLFYSQAAELGADIVVFPELCICGYPPEDLLLKSHFVEDNNLALEQFAKDCADKDIAVITGFAEKNKTGFFNSLAVLQKGRIEKIYRKRILPNYGVFDERRYFRPGTESVTINIKGLSIVLTICEDIWQPEWLDVFLRDFPRKDVIVNISASPFHIGKIDQRQKVLSRCATYLDCAVAYCNLIGGQDELVFDGRSMFLDATGAIVSQAKAFAEDLLVADIGLTAGRKGSKRVVINPVKTETKRSSTKPTSVVAEVYEALVLGTRDYVLKNGFRKVLVGLSGGIDSSLTAAIAVDALGTENVVAVTMPSKFNSPQTINDASVVAKNLGIEFHTIPISEVLERFHKTLGIVKGWSEVGVAYENLQARIRGTILMSLSNQFSYLVLTTGNKSEIAVGYTTLYGDTAGGFAVIKDVPKTMVYQLANYVNKIHKRAVIPQSIIARPPTAELKQNQKDTDLLPEYSLLDRILKGYIEDDKSPKELVSQGLPKDVVSRVVRMVDFNEYKRRQSPPGVKITPKAFGRDRRMPITNFYKQGGLP